MQLNVPDPEYTASRRAKANFVLAIKITSVFVVLMWLVFVLQQILPFDLARLGLRPRDGMGLIGLLTTPLLHGSLAHIGSNTAPLFVGGVAMLFLYPNSSMRALPLIYIGSAALAWTFARPSIHIGASGLVYGILTFVFVSGILRRDIRSVGVSLMVWFLYGSMIWGIFPSGRSMSWELHASGMAIGLVLALMFRSWDRPPVKKYDWEDEDDEEVDLDFDPGQSDSSWRDDRWH
jgi:membrane associated rhomboid family serine protease